MNSQEEENIQIMNLEGVDLMRKIVFEAGEMANTEEDAVIKRKVKIAQAPESTYDLWTTVKEGTEDVIVYLFNPYEPGTGEGPIIPLEWFHSQDHDNILEQMWRAVRSQNTYGGLTITERTLRNMMDTINLENTQMERHLTDFERDNMIPK